MRNGACMINFFYIYGIKVMTAVVRINGPHRSISISYQTCEFKKIFQFFVSYIKTRKMTVLRYILIK